MEQFKLVPALGPLGDHLHFSQSSLLMVLAGGLVLLALRLGMAPKAVVPGRLQALAEMSYQGLMSLTVGSIGDEGKRYFPFVFTLFFFILIGNLLGLVPYFGFAYTSHIVVTFALAMLVFLLATGVALLTHGLRFFTYFLPAGTPVLLAPLVIPIEIISYLSRPISLSIRLFANMMAGHVLLDVFAYFVILLGSAGILGGIAAIVPMGFTVALVGFELLVAFLQAYVFSVLTCLYLHDAVHLH
jgi:F-type H+-transporting ATPase subunit a